MKRVSKIFSLALILALALPLFFTPFAAEAAEKNDPLQYYLYYDKKVNEAQFLVVNPTNKVVNLQFPSGKDFDLELRKDNQVIWTSSEDQFYTQAIRNNQLHPGQGKLFKVKLPVLKDGIYDLTAYFEGNSYRNSAAANIRITIGNGIEDSIKYSLWYDKDTNKAYLLLQNTGTKHIKLTFPTAKEFDMELTNNKGKQVWKFSNGNFYGQALKNEWLAPGKIKLYSTVLPENFSGQYTLKAYFNGLNGVETPAASIKVKLDNKVTKRNLSFSAWYSTQTKPKLVFSVENTSNKTLKFKLPTTQIVEVIVKGENGFQWKFSDGIKFEQTAQLRELTPGNTSYNFIYLPNLPKGKYSAEIYYLGFSQTVPAVITNFSI